MTRHTLVNNQRAWVTLGRAFEVAGIEGRLFGPAHRVLREARWAGEVVEFAEIAEPLQIGRNGLRSVVRPFGRDGEETLARKEVADGVFEVGRGLELVVETRIWLQHGGFDVALMLDLFRRDSA